MKLSPVDSPAIIGPLNCFTRIIQTFTLLSSTAFLGSCFIEGGGCNGPVCFAVSTEVCGSGLFCGNNDDVNRCPDADEIESDSITLINRVRSDPGSCSIGQSQSAPPVIWNEQLFSAADLHSRDMASNNFINALGSDGLGVLDRLGQAGSPYITQSVAGGFSTPNALISAWQRDNQECSCLLYTSPSPRDS